MKNSFQKLYDDLKKTREKCPWIKEETLLSHMQALRDEIDEVKLAIEKKDDENLKEELGDVFMDALFLMVIAEERGFDTDEIIKKVDQKLVRRKPWVFGDMKITTREEAKKMWNEIKRKEKEQK